MARTPESTDGGIGLAGLLFITFLVLKLCGVISWSWWWVTAPLWGPPLAVLTVLFMAIIGAVVIGAVSSIINRKH